MLNVVEELEVEKVEKAGIFSKIAGIFSRAEQYDEEGDQFETAAPANQNQPIKIRPASKYNITIRRSVQSFQEAVAAADGLKKGEQQIINLTQTDSILRDKIKDFLCGVNYSQEGSWEEIGENIFLLAPVCTHVEVAPASARMKAMRN